MAASATAWTDTVVLIVLSLLPAAMQLIVPDMAVQSMLMPPMVVRVRALAISLDLTVQCCQAARAPAVVAMGA
jgi:hypothetical protein